MNRLLETLIRTFLFEQKNKKTKEPSSEEPKVKKTKELEPEITYTIRPDDTVKPEDNARYLKIINTDPSKVSLEDKIWWTEKGFGRPIGRGETMLPDMGILTKRGPSKQSVNKLLTNSSTSMDALNAYKLFNPSATPTAAGGFSVKINFKNEQEKSSVGGRKLLLKLSGVLAGSSTYGVISSKATGNHVYIISNNIKGDRKQLYNVWLMDKAWMDAHNMNEIFKIAGTDVYPIGSSKMIQWSTIMGIIKSQPELNKFTAEEIAAFNKINSSQSAIDAADLDMKSDAENQEIDARQQAEVDPIDQKPIVDPNTGKVEIVPKPAEELPRDTKVDPLNPPIVPGEADKEKPKEQVPVAKKLTPGAKVIINKTNGTLIDYYLWDGAKMVLKPKSWAVNSSDNIKYIRKSDADASLSLIEFKGADNTKTRYFVKTALLKVK